MNSFIKSIKNNPDKVLRLVLFFTFSGHGFVSLGFSPSIALHLNLVKATLKLLGWEGVDPYLILNIQAGFDIAVSIFILFGIAIRYVLILAIGYLIGVIGASWSFYWQQTENIFGIAEAFRRFPWIIFALTLLIYYTKGVWKFSLPRIGIAFAFLAHGIASLGFMGLRGGHIELAKNIVSEELATKFVFYSGFSDSIIGLLLLTGLFSRYVSYAGLLWITFIVILSAMTAFPDALFRLGFFTAMLYVTIEKRCHNQFV